jgi:3-isopropylmalate/(R)-2-methylmalate dehydratase small subunit
MTRRIRIISGRAYPLGRDNVDTDIILPGRFLKRITRLGMGEAAFEAIRTEPGNVLDDPDYAQAPILIAGRNFGCGSSREHAVWALLDLGVRAVIAESFSDIFAGNAFKNGLLTIVLPSQAIARLLEVAGSSPLSIDLEALLITTPDGDRYRFEIDEFRRHCLLNGLDEIALSLESEALISDYERRRDVLYPWAGAPDRVQSG